MREYTCFNLCLCLGYRCLIFTFSHISLAPLKNAIDWASRPPNVWADKAAAIVSAGGNFGGGRSQYHLRQIGVYLDLHFINKPEFFLNLFQPPSKFDSEGNLVDVATKEKLREILLSLYTFTLRLQGQWWTDPSGTNCFIQAQFLAASIVPQTWNCCAAVKTYTVINLSYFCM